MSYRRQKRWWNAYILFYEQVNETEPAVEDKTIIKTMQELTIGESFGPRFVCNNLVTLYCFWWIDYLVIIVNGNGALRVKNNKE